MGLNEDTNDCDNPTLKNTNVINENDKGMKIIPLSSLSNYQVIDSLSKITVLHIANCDITSIPNDIKHLQLKHLILANNKLKEVPSCLYSGLKNLVLLDLSYNNINNFVVNPECSNNIEILNISHNKMQNFPDWILSTPCPKLREVYYNGNYLVNLKSARSLNLKKLEMRNSQLIDVDFLFLQNIKSLEVLDIGNETQGEGQNHFKEINKLFGTFKWKNLEVLKLNNLVLSIIPSNLFYVSSLVELCLVNNDLNWISDDVQYLRNLEILDVSQNSLCSLPLLLTTLENLSVVKASHNCISSIPEFSNLKILDLYENMLESFDFSVDQFDFLDLEGNYFDTGNLADAYRNKLENYRKEFDFERESGPHDLPKDSETSEDDSKDSEGYSFEENREDALFSVDECWDDYEKPRTLMDRNPEITSSDDEWNGKVDIRVLKKVKRFEFDENEDWIFEDTE